MHAQTLKATVTVGQMLSDGSHLYEAEILPGKSSSALVGFSYYSAEEAVAEARLALDELGVVFVRLEVENLTDETIDPGDTVSRRSSPTAAERRADGRTRSRGEAARPGMEPRRGDDHRIYDHGRTTP